MHVMTASKTAWHGAYLYRANKRQIARVVLDPSAHSLGFAIGRRAVRVPLPYIPWHWVLRCSIIAPIYRLSSRFWAGLDGRYGWWRN